MNVFGDLPAWAIVILALLATVVLVVLNIGGLRSASALLDAQRHKRQSGSDRPPDPPARDT